MGVLWRPDNIRVSAVGAPSKRKKVPGQAIAVLERAGLYLLVYRAHLEIDSFLRLVSAFSLALHDTSRDYDCKINSLPSFSSNFFYLTRWLTDPVCLQAMDVQWM